MTSATRLVTLVAAVVVTSIALMHGPASAAGERVPVPDAAARRGFASKLRKEFREELKSKDAAVQRVLARTLLSRAGTTEHDVERYVLLDQAVLAAQAARDARLALEAVRRIAVRYQVPRAARSDKALTAIAKGAKEAGVLAEVASASIDVAGDALLEDDGSTAARAIGAAKSLSKKAKMDGLAARAAELAKLVSAFKKAAKAAAVARATLAETPDDPAAHGALGRFLCFGLADWETGLAHFTKSGDEGLKVLAALENAGASDAAGKLDLADAWWDAADAAKDPLARARMRARAAGCYEDALADAPADRKAAAQERLGAITYTAWGRGVALTADFSKFGPSSLALATIRAFIARKKIDRDGGLWRTKLPRFPEVSFAPGVDYFWHLETSEGPITLRFFPDTAPNHVANFLYLTEVGFFDGLIFHRVIPNFMAQGGCPKKDGSGNPGYFIDGEFETLRKHDKPGLLSMANTGQPRSDGSQFFITFVPYPSLDGKHTVFGEVTDGMDTLRKLEKQGTQGGRPRTQLVLESARVYAR
jgi:cyclophilin family peptidyl-prolyl cis-trans isomerase